MRIDLPKINLIAFDPGTAIGVCYYDGDAAWPREITEQGFEKLREEYSECKLWVIESYRLYLAKSSAQINSDLLVSQLIGTIKLRAKNLGVTVIMQSASQVKPLCTNDLLKEYGFYYPGSKHARDACRHALYYLLKHRKEVIEENKTETCTWCGLSILSKTGIIDEGESYHKTCFHNMNVDINKLKNSQLKTLREGVRR